MIIEKALHKARVLAFWERHGLVVALDTVERFVDGCRRYVITFEDIYTRFAFPWATTSHSSQAAKEFFGYCRKIFPVPFTFVLTDNGSEFKKDFANLWMISNKNTLYTLLKRYEDAGVLHSISQSK